MFDNFALAMAVRYGLPSNPSVEQTQLAVLDKLRREDGLYSPSRRA